MHDGLPARPESKLFKVFNGQLDTLKNEVRTLKSQLVESDHTSTSALNSLKIKHKQQISDLEAQLARRQHDGASAEKLLLQRDRQIEELEHKLSQPRLDTDRIEEALAERDHRINELQQQLFQHCIHAESVERSLVKRDQEIKNLQESSQHFFDIGHAAQLVNERNERISELEAQLSQRQLVTSNVQDSATAQRVVELEAQLSQRNTEVDSAQNLAHQLNQQVSHLQAQLDTAGIQITDLTGQLSQGRLKLASAQETINEVEGKSITEKLEFAVFHEEHDALREKHKALEERHNTCEAQLKFSQSRLADADKLYAQYVDLCNNWKHAQRIQAEVIDEGVDRAMASVEWQLRGRTAEETEQKCKEMGERLGGRVKPMLDMIRWQMEKRDEAPNKRKMEEAMEEGEEEEEAERGGKRQHRE